MKSTIVVTTMLAAALVAGCSVRAHSQAADAQPVPVRTAAVARAVAAPAVHGLGVVAGQREVVLSFETGGVVRRVHVAAGAVVKRGQILATLERSEIDARVALARHAAQKAERDFARLRNLFEQRAAPLEQLQNAETAHELAASQLAIVERLLRHASIVAPEDGHVLSRFVDADELVAPGKPVFAFSATRQGWVVRAGVAERDAVRLSLGDRARVELSAHPGEPLAAEVTEIAAGASPLTGTYTVELRLASTPLRLLSGMSARVTIEPSLVRPVYFVPLEALLEGDDDRGSVYTLEGARARRVPVRVAFLDQERIAIAEGLEGVDQVVVDGVSRLTDGAAVRIVR